MRAGRPPLGQHFLRDEGVLRRIVAAIDPRRDDRFVEIGPGTGRLTRPLLAAGARVHAIEYDRRLAAKLPGRLGALAGRLEVDCADAARGLPAELAPGWRLAGNIPYAISGPLIELLCAAAPPPRDCHLLVQREFARRLAAPAGSRAYGRLSVIAQAFFAPSLLFEVGPRAFAPAPKVTSALTRLEAGTLRERIASPPAFARLVRTAFSQRRKQLGATVGKLLELDAKLAARRAEELEVAQFVELANQLAGRASA